MDALFINQNRIQIFHQLNSVLASLHLAVVGVYILIAAGALMMVVGFLGCCGAIKESPCMLGLVSGTGQMLKWLHWSQIPHLGFGSAALWRPLVFVMRMPGRICSCVMKAASRLSSSSSSSSSLLWRWLLGSGVSPTRTRYRFFFRF